MNMILAGHLILLAITICLLCLAGFGWLNRRYRIPGTAPFIAFCVCSAIYTGGFAIELGQTTVDGYFLAARIQYLGLVFIPTAWVALVLAYTGRSRYLSRPVLAAMLSWSIAILIMVWTNNLHHWYYRAIIPNPDTGLARFVPGDLYPFASLSFYGSYTIGILCLQGLSARRGPHRRQFAVILGATALPVLGNLLYNLDFRPMGLDLSPFTLAPSAAIFAYGLFRNRLYAVVPIAREWVIESMADAVVVLDPQGRILDYNPAARLVFPQFGPDSLGKPCNGEQSPCRELGQSLAVATNSTGEFSLQRDTQVRWYQFQSSTITDSHGQALGKAVVINDRTDYRTLLGQMTELATHDPLTGVCNRRRFAEMAESEVRRCLRYGHRVSLVMFDVDHFKHINDTLGHKTGDQVLIEIARRAGEAIRTMDVLARIGGEEFMVMLPDTDAEGALQTAERIREALRSTPIHLENTENLQVTASFGISQLVSDNVSTCWDQEPAVTVILDQLMTQADDAMYKAKNAGRDQVVAHGLC